MNRPRQRTSVRPQLATGQKPDRVTQSKRSTRREPVRAQGWDRTLKWLRSSGTFLEPTERRQTDPDVPDGWEADLWDPDSRSWVAPAPDDAVQSVGFSPATLSCWIEDGVPCFEAVSEPSLESPGRGDRDHLTVLDTYRAFGSGLCARQPAALRATSLTKAFQALTPMTQKEFAASVGKSEGTVSKLNDLIVETPHWSAPLRFFTWGQHDSIPRRLRSIAEVLSAEGGRQALLGDGARINKSHVGRRAQGLMVERFSMETWKNDVTMMMQLYSGWSHVEKAQMRWPGPLDLKRLREDLGFPDGRGSTVVHLAVLGWFNDVLEGPRKEDG